MFLNCCLLNGILEVEIRRSRSLNPVGDQRTGRRPVDDYHVYYTRSRRALFSPGWYDQAVHEQGTGR